MRSQEEVFGDFPDLEIEGEMLDLAKHIIGTKMGEFHPRGFDDRYDDAVAELVNGLSLPASFSSRRKSSPATFCVNPVRTRPAYTSLPFS